MLSVSVESDECSCSGMIKYLRFRVVVEEQARLLFVEWMRLPMSRAQYNHSALASRKMRERI